MQVYWLSIVGVLALCHLSVLLAIYSGSSKGRLGVLSGPIVPGDAVPAVLAMLVGVGPATLAAIVWLHLAIRLVHLGVYVRGGNAAKGGSVRTILYVSGAVVTLVLVIVTGWAAIP